MAQKKNKDLDSEINLIPFISLLSVLICSLLLTAIWIQIGSMEVKQAVGGQPADETEKKPSVWAFLSTDGSVVFQLQDAPRVSRSLLKAKVEGKEGKIDKEAIKGHVQALQKSIPDLTTALIQPKKETVYEDIIALMDHLKSAGMADLGVAPL